MPTPPSYAVVPGRRARLTVGGVVAALLLALSGVLVPAASAADTADVSGLVVDNAGNPLPGITVDLGTDGGSDYQSVTTTSSGTFAFDPATPGRATLDAYDEGYTYEHQSWNGTRSVSDYTHFTLASGSTSITLTLPPQHRIVGTATDTAGHPIPDVGYEIEYLLPDGTWQGPQEGPLLTDAAGRFTWRTEPGRTYRFCFADNYYGDDVSSPGRTTRYASRCWRRGTTIQQATDIPVTSATPLEQSFTVPLKTAGRAMTPTEPFVYGKALVGSTLTVDTGRWQPAGVRFTYAWTYYDEQARVVRTIPGATGSSYTPTSADAGRSLSAVVTGRATGYAPAPQGAYAGTVGERVPASTAPLTVSGSGAAGQPLTARHGTLRPAASGVEYTWLVDGMIAKTGYGDPTFVPSAADVGKVVTLRYLAYTDRSGYGEVHDYLVGPEVHS